MKRIALVLASCLALAGCFAASLENAPCKTADDCAGRYQCVYTESQKAAADGVGFCRPDDSCAPGLQDGCVVEGNACADADLEVVCDSETDMCFCCNIGFDDIDALYGDAPPVVGIGDIAGDGSSAVCIICSAEACDSPLEPCLRDEERCELDDEDDTCGCRVREEDIEDSECDTDEDCGGGDYVCVRTLEQLAEPLEALGENQAQEKGLCRPGSDATCTPGIQNGCRIDTGYDSCTDLQQQCNEVGQCFCCASQTEASGFSPQVYAVAEDGSSAACTACPYCDEGNTCTRETDATCDLAPNSVCGCTPPVG